MVTQPLGRILAPDRAHIECLQWFTLREGYRLEALLQFTESIRAFVREEKLQAAAAVVDLMPADTASVCEALLKACAVPPDWSQRWAFSHQTCFLLMKVNLWFHPSHFF